MYAGDHPELLRAVGRGLFVGLENLVSRKIGLEDLVEKGIKGLIKEKDEMGTSFVHTSGEYPTVLTTLQ